METLTTSQNYVSSIIHKFGDESNVINDAITLHNIINKQGTIILSECLAEYIGQCKLKNKLSHEEAIKLLESIVSDLKGATYERI